MDYNISLKDFMKKYVVCKCGYNNEKNRLNQFGFCLSCGNILDKKAYFKYKMRNKLGRYYKK